MNKLYGSEFAKTHFTYRLETNLARFRGSALISGVAPLESAVLLPPGRAGRKLARVETGGSIPCRGVKKLRRYDD